MNLNIETHLLEENIHEVVLSVTVTAKAGDKSAFLVELQQAGLFHISGYGDEEFKALIGSFCPNILFPYARETISGMVAKGGFPEFLLQPINFDALYAQGLAQAKAKAEAAVAAPAGDGGGEATH